MTEEKKENEHDGPKALSEEESEKVAGGDGNSYTPPNYGSNQGPAI